MTDYIRREALITAACERCNGEYVPCDKEHCLLMEVIHSIPAADVRPVVRGKWIWKENGEVVCSKCNYLMAVVGNTEDFITVKSYHNFCPNCGAMMEES